MKARAKTNEFWTVEELADYLQVNPMTIYRKAKRGELPALWIGRLLRFRRTDIEAYLATCKRPRKPRTFRQEV